jgi:hypothetical protein
MSHRHCRVLSGDTSPIMETHYRTVPIPYLTLPISESRGLYVLTAIAKNARRFLPSTLTTCYVGVSFFKSVAGDTLMTSVAQVFDERGEGLIVQGGSASYDKDDRSPHLSREDSQELLATGLATYRREHKTMPARLVMHKTSNFNGAEKEGFTRAAEDEKLEVLDHRRASNHGRIARAQHAGPRSAHRHEGRITAGPGYCASSLAPQWPQRRIPDSSALPRLIGVGLGARVRHPPCSRAPCGNSRLS